MLPFLPAAGGLALGTKLMIGAAIAATFTGMLLAGIQTIAAGGYAKAEAERRAAIAQQNADELKRERRLGVSAREREARVLAELEAARTVTTPPPSGTQCVPGCLR